MEKKRQSKRSMGVLIGIILLLIISLVVGACAKAPAPAAPAPAPAAPGAPTPAPGAPTPAKPAAPGAPTPAPAAVKPIELVFSSASQKTDRTNAVLTENWYMEEVKKRTGGRVVFKEYWGGALAATQLESWDLLRQGAIDQTQICPTCISIEIFKWEIPLNSIIVMVKTLQEQNRIARAFYQENAFQRAQWEDHNTKIMILNGQGPYTVASNTPLKTLDDLKGKKFYSWSTYTSRLYTAVGAVPVAIYVTAEQYDALRTGLLQGLTKDLVWLKANKMWEVAPYLTFVGFGSAYGAPDVMNLKRFNSLPDDIKKIMTDLWLEADDMQISYHEMLQKEAYDELSKHMTFFTLSQEDRAKWAAAYGGVEGMAETWLDEMEKKRGIPRAEALRFLRRLQELAAPGWKVADPNRAPDWVYKSPLTGQTLPRIFP